MRFSALIFVVGVGSALGLTGGVAAHELLPESPVVRGIFIGGQRVPDGVSPASWLAERNEQLSSRAVVFRHEDDVFESTLGDVGVAIDVEATLREAERVGHEGSWVGRVEAARAAKRGEIDIPFVWRINIPRATTVLEGYAEQLHKDPVNARLDLNNLTKIPDEPGQDLDIQASLAQLRLGEHGPEETIELVTKPIRAGLTVDDLVNVDVSKVVSSYETTFRTWGSGVGRSKNIRTAADYLDGQVLAPGAVLSFNDVVGARTMERGFTWAPEIQGDEMTTGIGGGTCQVSTTLFAAALFGAMEIVDRRSHSRPSSYTKLGLDATVSYPKVDLKIRNTLDHPVLIHAWLPEEDKIRVDILGGDPVAEVSYRYGIARVEDFVRRITVKPHLPSGKKLRRQKGSRGMDVTSLVTVSYPDGRVNEFSYFSGYRPAPEVYWIAPDYDEQELPPLPKHALGVEGRIEQDIYPM